MSKRRLTGRQKWSRRLAVGFLIYTVVGFLVLPALIKWQMIKQLPKFTHRAARVDSVRLNPYALSFGIRGFALTEADGSTFLSFSNLHVNFEMWSSLFNRAWTVGEFRLGSPYAYVSVLTNGQFNFANLLTNAPATNEPAPPAKPMPAALIKSLAITNGVLAIADFYRPVPFQTKFEPIEVRLTNFTTRPRTKGPYAFTASTGEGEYFRWGGSVHVVPPASQGHFELGGIDLKKYGTYAREFSRLEVRDGKVTVAATYHFAVESNGLELRMTNASVQVTNLAVFAPESSNALMTIPSVAIREVEADLQKRAARVRAVETTGGSILARRFQDGTLELLHLAMPPTNRPFTLLNPPPSPSAATSIAATNAPPEPWSVLVDEIVVKDYAARVEDAQPPRAATVVADQIALTVKGFSLASNAPIDVEFSTRVNSNGLVKAAARGTVRPVAMETDLEVSTIELKPFQPYVEQQQVKLSFNSGHVSTKGKAFVALGGSNQLTAKFAGDVVLGDVAVIDQIAFQDFIRWKQVAVRGIDFALDPMSVKIHELACDGLATSVVLGTNRQLMALAVLPPARTNAPAASPATPIAKPGGGQPAGLLPFPVQLDLLAMTNMSVHLRDLSIQPNCRFDVQQFSGTVRGLSSALNTAADVDISGRMNEASRFSVTGKVNPLVRDLLVDLVITNYNMELTPFTPYMEKFAGYPLSKGKVTVGLKYDVKQQALDAQNIIFIDQLTLGAKNNSPDTTKLPVKLGVALLKDRNGRIEFDVPVKGRLDDPKFKVGPIIWQVVVNLLTRAATSPFSLLGALVGGGPELAYVEFAPGQAVMLSGESNKIDKLSQALYERPALNLEITGAADPALDAAALAWFKLERELKTARMAELASRNDAPSSADAVKLEKRDYERLLKVQYRKVFNRDRPLPAVVTNATGTVTNAAPAPVRAQPRKGAEVQIAREPVVKQPAKDTNVVASALDPRIPTRPGSLPALEADDELRAQMENELHAHFAATAEDLRALMNERALAVQRALLQTEKVAADRLFILAPPAGDAASKGQSRVNLSLN